MSDGRKQAPPSLSRRALLTAGAWLASASTLLGVSGFQARTAGARVQVGELEGSWVVTTGTSILDTPTFLMTFIPNGALVGSNVQHGTAIHGAWMRIGDREFAYTAWQLRFDPGGTHIGTARARAQLTLEENLTEYTARTVTELYDREGNLLESNTLTPRGQRLSVEPLT